MMQDPNTQDLAPAAPPDGWIVWTFEDGTFLIFDTGRAMLAVPVLIFVLLVFLLWTKRREEKNPKPKPKK